VPYLRLKFKCFIVTNFGAELTLIKNLAYSQQMQELGNALNLKLHEVYG